MTLIKSISGIRGTIGGKAGEGLNPLDIVKFTSAYATLIRRISTVGSNKIGLTKEEQSKFHCVKGDTEGFVNIPLQMKGICFSAFLREDTEKI